MSDVTRPPTPNTLIRVSPETREKLDAIARVKRWKLKAAIDALADAFMEREGIRLPRRREKASA